jgi:sarcosine oxidase subunit alpha
VVIVDENARRWQRPVPARHGTPRSTSSCSRVRAMPRSACSKHLRRGYYADQWIPLVDADKMTKMRAKAVIVASGAFEQPAVFRNNDLPGVMLGSAMQRLIYRFAVLPASEPWSSRRMPMAIVSRSILLRRVARSPPLSICAVRCRHHPNPKQCASAASNATLLTQCLKRMPIRGELAGVTICRIDSARQACFRQRTAHRLRRSCDEHGLGAGSQPACTRPAPRCVSMTCCSSSCPTSCRRAYSPAAA